MISVVFFPAVSFSYNRSNFHLPSSVRSNSVSISHSALQNTPKILTNQAPKTSIKAMLHQSPIISDLYAFTFSISLSLAILRVTEETARRNIFSRAMNRKVLHVAIGLAFMACWPLFYPGHRGALLACVVPGLQVLRMLLIGSGLWKDEDSVKSISRSGNKRELLSGPLYYCTALTLVCAVHWISPVSIAVICNLCAGDGFADIIGRRFGKVKLAYNGEKSVVGSVAMFACGYLTSVGYMVYFTKMGMIEGNPNISLGLLVASLVCAVVESLPLSSKVDDNFTVPFTAWVLGTLLF